MVAPVLVVTTGVVSVCTFTVMALDTAVQPLLFETVQVYVPLLFTDFVLVVPPPVHE